MIDFLASMPFWHWWVLAVVLLMIEIATGTTYFLWPAASAAVVGLADLWPLDGQWRAQLVLFAVLTVVLTVFATPRVRPLLQKGQTDHLTLNERGAQKIGRRAIVDEAFVSGAGRVRLGDTVWAAESEGAAAFDKGAEVEIVRVDGAKLVVKAAV
jgi:membrane protein implicated in regulation of membrane protease activity